MRARGVGLGLRKELVNNLLEEAPPFTPNFIELAPENWMKIGGRKRIQLKELSEKYPITTHGLSLSIGSPEKLDYDFTKNIKVFLDEYQVEIYSEHLSYSKCDNAHLYDLLPIPFCEEAVKHVASRIREVQDLLERKIAIENVSYYTPVAPEMSEQEFIRAIIEEADCNLLLDINNVYVNSFNHKYDPKEFLDSLPLDRVAYIHMAGHHQVSEELIIDTHGNPIIDPVFDLFKWTLPKLSPLPVLLERDFNIPEAEELNGELKKLKKIAEGSWGDVASAA